MAGAKGCHWNRQTIKRDYPEYLGSILSIASHNCSSNIVPSSILYRYQDRSAHTHICIHNTHTHQRLLKRLRAHTPLPEEQSLILNTPSHGSQLPVLPAAGDLIDTLATSGNCTHMHMIKTNKPWRARVSEERPGEATGQSQPTCSRRPQQFRDASTMPDIAAAAAVAVEWSQSEPRRQVVCAALRSWESDPRPLK